MDGWRNRLSHMAARLLPLDMAWYRGRPIISFTFDDFPLSAAETAAQLLERHDARGTFYAATGLMGEHHDLWPMASADALRPLAEVGHEIGLHTHAHKRVWDYDAAGLQADLDRNRNAIAAQIGFYRPETFAYPYGVGRIDTKRWLATRLRGSRSVQPGINAGVIDLQFLRACELTDRTLSLTAACDLIDSAVKSRGWLIFVSHDVSDQPTAHGVSPALLQGAVRHALARGALILPVCEALDLVGVALDRSHDSREGQAEMLGKTATK